MRQLGEKLRQYRDRENLSQDQVAGSTGLTQKYISQVERGLRPRVSVITIMSIAQVVKCPPEILFGSLTEEDLQALESIRKIGKSMKKE